MGLGANRLLAKKPSDVSMGPPIRKSKDALTNLEIILSHVQKGETILQALSLYDTHIDPLYDTHIVPI